MNGTRGLAIALSALLIGCDPAPRTTGNDIKVDKGVVDLVYHSEDGAGYAIYSVYYRDGRIVRYRSLRRQNIVFRANFENAVTYDTDDLLIQRVDFAQP